MEKVEDLEANVSEKIKTRSITENEIYEAHDDGSESRVVERSERRGLFVQLCWIPEYKDPREHTKIVKSYLLAVISTAAAVGPATTSITYPAMEGMVTDLNSTRFVLNATVGLFVLATGVFPLWWSSFSERYGRRSIYLVSFVMFFGFTLGCALSKDVVTFAILRTLAGASSASVLAVGAGTIADLYEPKNRGEALGYYYLGPLISPLLAPIIGSLLLIKWNWRASQWFLVILSGLMLICTLFTLPETLRLQDQDPMVHKQEEELKKMKKSKRFAREAYLTLIKPLKALRLLRYLPVILTVQQGSMLFAILYLITIGLQYEFAEDPYNWKAIYIGFAYSPQSIVFIIFSVLGGKYIDRRLTRFKKKHGYYAPECRLSYNVVLGCITLPISALIIGWCFNFHTFWVTPLIGTSIFGIALPMLTGPVVTYLVDSLPGRGASGVAVLNFVRSIFACVSVFVFDPMVKKMKPGPMFTLFAGVSLFSSLTTLYLKRNGARLREECDFEKLYASLE